MNTPLQNLCDLLRQGIIPYSAIIDREPYIINVLKQRKPKMTYPFWNVENKENTTIRFLDDWIDINDRWWEKKKEIVVFAIETNETITFYNSYRSLEDIISKRKPLMNIVKIFEQPTSDDDYNFEHLLASIVNIPHFKFPLYVLRDEIWWKYSPETLLTKV